MATLEVETPLFARESAAGVSTKGVRSVNWKRPFFNCWRSAHTGVVGDGSGRVKVPVRRFWSKSRITGVHQLRAKLPARSGDTLTFRRICLRWTTTVVVMVTKTELSNLILLAKDESGTWSRLFGETLLRKTTAVEPWWKRQARGTVLHKLSLPGYEMVITPSTEMSGLSYNTIRIQTWI